MGFESLPYNLNNLQRTMNLSGIQSEMEGEDILMPRSASCKMPGAREELHSDSVSITSNSSENSNEWCDGSVSSLVSIGKSDASSVTSHFSCDIISSEDLNCILNLEPVKIEAILYKKCLSEAQARQRQTAIPKRIDATVVSSNSSMMSSGFGDHDDDDLDSLIDEMMHPFSLFEHSSRRALVQSASVVPTPSPFAILPDEIICKIFSYLDIESLIESRCVSQRFKTLASRDDAGWKSMCNVLWRRKAHVCWRSIQLKEANSSMEAYRESCRDGRSRHEISPNELCFDPMTGRGTIWYFRFKETAGPSWTSFDPWYRGLDARKMVFLRDGTVWQLLSGDTPGSSLELKPAFFDADAHNLPLAQTAPSSRVEMKWRFVLQPMDLPLRPLGAYVRLNVGGRDVPTHVVHRSPTGNWGFVLENCWGVFASFPLPRRQDTSRARPNNRPARIRLRRTSAGVGRWLNVDGLESDSEDEDVVEVADPQNHDSETLLLDDADLAITNRCQWREALLYNYGAVSLPEGEIAKSEFDRIFYSYRSPRREATDMHNFLGL
jgi:hypothetical protein